MTSAFHLDHILALVSSTKGEQMEREGRELAVRVQSGIDEELNQTSREVLLIL